MLPFSVLNDLNKSLPKTISTEINLASLDFPTFGSPHRIVNPTGINGSIIHLELFPS